MRRGAARWSRWTAAAAISTVVVAAGLPARTALAVSQTDLQAESIDTPAGQPQPAVFPLNVGIQPFGLSVFTASGDCGIRFAGTDVTGEQVKFSDCDSLFVADPANYVVRVIANTFLQSGDNSFPTLGERVLAGNGGKGTEGDGGIPTAAQLSGPYTTDVDPVSGQVFIADTFANQVRTVPVPIEGPPTITRLAGLASGAFGFTGDGSDATKVGLASPYGIARGNGVTYVADTLDNRVLEISDRGVRTIVGTGTAGFSGDDHVGIHAQLNRPRGLVFSDGVLLIADTGNNVIRQWEPDGGVIRTIVGPAAGLKEPTGIAVDPATGSLFIADTDNNRVRKVDGSSRAISTFAGTGTAGFSGDGGAATSAQLDAPFAVAVLSTGSVVIGDTGNSRIRIVEGANDAHPGRIATLAGDGTASHANAAGGSLDQLSGPTAVAAITVQDPLAGDLCDAAGPVTVRLVLDTFNHRLGAQCPGFGSFVLDVIGDGLPGTSPASGAIVASGPAPSRLRYPMGLAVRGGVRPVFYVADTFNNVVRAIDPTALTVRTVAGTGVAGSLGDGHAATQAQLNHPGGLAVDRDGNLYIADTYNDRVRKVDTSGTIGTVAGTGVSGSGGDGGPATAATLFFPEGVAVDASSPANVFIADTFSHRIRRIDTAGTITTFAGSTEGFADGPAATAKFDRPWAVSVDSTPGPVGPVVYVADELNHRVRFVASGTVSTLTTPPGPRGLHGDQGPVNAAEVDSPRGVTVLDNAGTLLVADSFNDRTRRTGLGQLTVAVESNGAFGGVRTGTSSAALLAIIKNVGTGFTHVSLSPPAAPFHAGASNCGGGLAPGDTCSVPVVFAPTTVVAQAGTIKAASDAGSAASAGLTGTGTQPALGLAVGTQQLQPACTPAPKQCIWSLPTTAGTTTTLTIENTGTALLHVTGLQITPSGVPFTLVQPASTANLCTPLAATASSATWPDTTIQPGQSCNLAIQTTNQGTATLGLITDDGPVPTSTHQTLTLVGGSNIH